MKDDDSVLLNRTPARCRSEYLQSVNFTGLSKEVALITEDYLVTCLLFQQSWGSVALAFRLCFISEEQLYAFRYSVLLLRPPFSK